MIKISTDIPKPLISNIVSTYIDKGLESEPLDYKGFDVKIKRQGKIHIVARKKSIFIDLPLDVHIAKPNGLFSIEATGTILLNATIAVDISNDLQLSSKTTIDGWKWITEPSVKVGVINLPVSALANLVMNRMDDTITAQIDEAVANKINLQELINKKLAALIDSRKISEDPELYLRAQLIGVECPGFRESTDSIELPLYLNIENQISSEYQASSDWGVPPFTWIDNDFLEYSQDVNISLQYDKLEKIILSKLNGLVIGGKELAADNIEIDYDGLLHIKVNLTAPIESMLTLSGNPVMEDGTINLTDIDVDMKTPNIIYKMTSPIIEKLIRAEIDNKFPIDIQELMREQLNLGLASTNKFPFFDIRIDAKQATITDLSFSESELNACINAKDVDIAVLLEHLGGIVGIIA